MRQDDEGEMRDGWILRRAEERQSDERRDVEKMEDVGREAHDGEKQEEKQEKQRLCVSWGAIGKSAC